MVETVDSAKLASALSSSWGKQNKQNLLNIMVQVNTSEEDSKYIYFSIIIIIIIIIIVVVVVVVVVTIIIIIIIIINVIKYSLSSVNFIWSEAQSHLPKNIYNFTIRYINNSLPTRKNMARWGLSQSPDCSFCLNLESLLHVVAGCQQ